MSNKSVIVVSVIIVFAVVIGFLGFQLMKSQNEIKKQQEDLESASQLLDLEKKQTEKDFQALAAEMDGYGSTIKNDSLLSLLDAQKQKIRLLLDELHTVKSTNAKKIAQLKEELATVRKVLINYIRQVDSLSKMNKGLVTENFQVKQKYTEMNQAAQELTKEKDALTEQVGRAAQLEADNILIATLNKKDKKTDNLNKIKSISVTFSIAKNVTAQVGDKTIYARLTKPNNDVLCKNNHYTFTYENKNIQYSMKKDIEYKGDRLTDEMIWEVNETLMPGSYRVDLFADSRLIGSTNFTLKK